MTERLTSIDVRRLIADPSAENRTRTAEKIALEFDGGLLKPDERRIAEEIFRLMVRDAELRVRTALSENLKECAQLPHDLALELARDVDEVALPILEFNQVLSDDDLIDIVRSQGSQKQMAIARRASVSDAVSSALVDHGDVEVVTTLVRNPGAELSEATLDKVIDKHGDVEAVQQPLVDRHSLPLPIIERLVAKVSEQLKEQLVAKHDMPPDMAADLIIDSREQATVSLAGGKTRSDEELMALLQQLRFNGRLTPSLLLRATCTGDMQFLEAGLAVLIGIPMSNASKLVQEGGELGFRSIYDRAGLPARLYPAFRAAVWVAMETEYDGGPEDRQRYARRTIERFVTQIEDLEGTLSDDDLDYLLDKLERYTKPVPAV